MTMRLKINLWVDQKLAQLTEVWPWAERLWWTYDVTIWVTCKIWGHQPERDQCHRPEHDFCVWCSKSMPNSWSPE